MFQRRQIFVFPCKNFLSIKRIKRKNKNVFISASFDRFFEKFSSISGFFFDLEDTRTTGKFWLRKNTFRGSGSKIDAKIFCFLLLPVYTLNEKCSIFFSIFKKTDVLSIVPSHFGGSTLLPQHLGFILFFKATLKP